MNKKTLIILLLSIISFFLIGCNKENQEEIYFNEILENHLYSEDISYDYKSDINKSFEVNNDLLLQGMIKMLYCNSRLEELTSKLEKDYNKELENVTITSKIDNETLIIKIYNDDMVIVNVNNDKYHTKSDKIKFTDFTTFVDIGELFSSSIGTTELYLSEKLYICSNNYSNYTVSANEFDDDIFMKNIKQLIELYKGSYSKLSEEELNYYLMGYDKQYPNIDYESKLKDPNFVNSYYYNQFNDEELQKLIYGYDDLKDFVINNLLIEYLCKYRFYLNMKYFEKLKDSSIPFLYIPYEYINEEREFYTIDEIQAEAEEKIHFIFSAFNGTKIPINGIHIYDGFGFGRSGDRYDQKGKGTYLIDSSYFDNFVNEFNQIEEENKIEYNNFKKELEKLWLELEN